MGLEPPLGHVRVDAPSDHVLEASMPPSPEAVFVAQVAQDLKREHAFDTMKALRTARVCWANLLPRYRSHVVAETLADAVAIDDEADGGRMVFPSPRDDSPPRGDS